MMDSRYQVKQYVGEVKSKTSLFRVFLTGDSQYYLFSQLTPKTKCDIGLHFPVKKTRLKHEVAYALNNGCSYYVN